MSIAPKSPTISPVSFAERLATIRSFFDPQLVGVVNDRAIKLTKMKGEFPWHFHEGEDELFLVVKGLSWNRTHCVWKDEGCTSHPAHDSEGQADPRDALGSGWTA